MTLLVRAGTLLLGFAPDGSPRLVRDAGLLVEDGRVAGAGTWFDVVARCPGAPVIGGPRSIVLPGLVNAHHHTGLTPTQNGIPDLPLEFWLPRLMGGRVLDPYLDTLVSAVEMAECGVTTVQHIHGGLAGPEQAWERTTEAILAAYREVGLRASLCFMVRDQNRVVYGDDGAFLATLPTDLAALLAAVLAERTIPVGDQLDWFAALAGRHAADGRVCIQLAPASLHWCSDACLGQMRDMADRMGCGLHMHLAETWYQKVAADRRCGCSAVEHLDRLGLLGPRLTLGHGIWVTEEDLDRIAETGTRVCHQASSALRLRSGLAPIAPMRGRRIPVALGIDQAGLNDDRDMLLEMRLAAALQGQPGHGEDRAGLSAAEVVRMATEHGAATTGFCDRIGALDEGREADLFVLGPDLAGAWPGDEADALTTVLRRAKPEHVTDVLVGGRAIKRDGRLSGPDPADVRRRVAEALDRAPTGAEATRRRMALALDPHLRRFYADWPPAPAPPRFCCPA